MLQQLPLPLRSISKFSRYRKTCSHIKNLGERSGLCDFKYSQLIRERGACLCYRDSGQWGRQHGTSLCVSRFIYPVSISGSQGTCHSNRGGENESTHELIIIPIFLYNTFAKIRRYSQNPYIWVLKLCEITVYSG